MKKLYSILQNALLCAAFCLLTSAQLFGSHAAGGDLTYRCLGGLQYEVTYTYFRDCSGITPPASMIANVSNGCSLTAVSATLNQVGGAIQVPLGCGLGLSTCNGGTVVGLERYTYRGVVTLPGRCASFNFSIVDCCRSTSISNLANAASFQIYAEATLNNTGVICNNSPTFSAGTQFVFCANAMANLSLAATDPDGDQLTYSFVQPRDAQNTPIAYATPFTVSSPLPTSNGFNLSPVTGSVGFTPTQVGVYTVAVRVDEYRNNQLIGSVMRDINIYVIACQTNTNAAPIFTGVTVTGGTLNGNTISTCPGSTLLIRVSYADANAQDSLLFGTDALQMLPNSVVTPTSGPTVGSGNANILWNASNLSVPATINLNVRDNACPVPGVVNRDFVIVTSGSPIQVTASNYNICAGVPTTITLGSSAQGSGTYLWSNGSTQANPVVTVSQTTTFSVTFTPSSGGCSQVGTVVINASSQQLFVSGQPNVICYADTVNIYATGGGGTYLWSGPGIIGSNAQPTIMAYVSASSVYRVTATSQQGCISTASFGVSLTAPSVAVSGTQAICAGQSVNLNALMAGDALGTQINCNAYSVSSVTYAPMTGAGTIVTLTDDSSTPAIALPFTFDFYCVPMTNLFINSNGIVSFGTGTTSYQNIAIPDVAVPNNIIAGIWDDLNPSNGGQIGYFTSGTAPNRTFVIGYDNVPFFNSTVTASFQIHLKENGDVIEIHNNNINVTSNATQGIENVDGTFGSSVPGRNAANFTTGQDAWRFTPATSTANQQGFSYSWSPSSGLNNTNVSGPVASPQQTTVYTVTSRNVQGCTASNSVTVTVGTPSATISGTSFTLCEGQMQTITAAGGTSYAWSGPNGFTANTASISVMAPVAALQNGDMYMVTVTSPNSCPSIMSAMVYSTPATTITNRDACTGFPATVAALCGTSWVWSDGQVGQTAIFNAAGTYCLTTTDANGAQSTSCFVLGSNPALQATIFTQSPMICTGNYASLDVSVQGQNAPYIFLWNTGETMPYILVNMGGLYEVTVTDMNGCSTTADIFIIENQAFNITLQTTDADCQGNNGTAMVLNAPTSASITWSNGAFGPMVTGLNGGTYTVQMFDGMTGCFASETFAIQSAVTFGLATSGSICGGATGMADVTLPSGMSQSTVAWSNGATGTMVTGLASGWYSVTVSDASGCRSHRNFFIDEITSCFANITGYAYNDSASPDCNVDAQTTPIPYVLIALLNQNGVVIAYDYTDSLGRYEFLANQIGTFTIQAMPWGNSWTAVCNGGIITTGQLSSGAVSNGNNFFFQFNQVQDVSIQMYAPIVRPGFQPYFSPCITNNGGSPSSGTVSFSYDPAFVTFLPSSFSVAPTSIDQVNHIITWSYSNLAPYGQMCFGGYLTVSANQALGSTMIVGATVTPIGTDANAANNVVNLGIIVRGSYDPNAKLVLPEGTGINHDINANTELLTYVLQFENTGSDTAFSVVLKDPIDLTKLDITTARPFDASHPYTMEIEGNNVLRFHFQDINLPWTAVNPSASKGYVAFTIRLRPNLPLGTRIDNNTDIYFDYNAPIRTNTAFVTLATPNGLQVSEELGLSTELFPNPTNGTATLRYSLERESKLEITLMDMQGKQMANLFQSDAQSAGTYNVAIDANQLAAGVYFVQMKTAQGVMSQKLVVIR